MNEPNPCSRDEWPIKAYKNLNFLNSEPARQIRVLCELIEPGPRLEAEKIEDTVVLFGSARTRPRKRLQPTWNAFKQRSRT